MKRPAAAMGSGGGAEKRQKRPASTVNSSAEEPPDVKPDLSYDSDDDREVTAQFGCNHPYWFMRLAKAVASSCNNKNQKDKGEGKDDTDLAALFNPTDDDEHRASPTAESARSSSATP